MIDRIALKRRLSGILPPMTTPFDAEGEVEYASIRGQVEFMLDAGVHGIVAGGSTGEGHTLSQDEFGAVMAATADVIGDRCAFVPGIIVNSTRSALRRAAALKDIRVDALQVTPVHYLFKPDGDETVEHFRVIAEETEFPIIIYNVIPWNYLPTQLLYRILREVPGVVGVKQSAGDFKTLSDLLVEAEPDTIILSGIDALLYPAFNLGVDGAITALLAAVPHATVRLWDLVQAGDKDGARDLHSRLLGLWNVLTIDNLPGCVKFIQNEQGCPLSLPRAPMTPPGDAQKNRILDALEKLGNHASKH